MKRHANVWLIAFAMGLAALLAAGGCNPGPKPVDTPQSEVIQKPTGDQKAPVQAPGPKEETPTTK